MIKLKEYTDNTRRFPVKVDFHIARGTLVTILAYEYEFIDDRPARLTKAHVERAVKEHVKSFGYTEVDVASEEAWEWAEAQVARLFPDWED